MTILLSRLMLEFTLMEVFLRVTSTIKLLKKQEDGDGSWLPCVAKFFWGPPPALLQIAVWHTSTLWQIMSKGTNYRLKVPALHNIHEQAATAGSRVVLHLVLGPPLTLLSSVRINHLCNNTIYELSMTLTVTSTTVRHRSNFLTQIFRDTNILTNTNYAMYCHQNKLDWGKINLHNQKEC